MSERLILLLIFYPVLLFSLSFHESAHAWMADKFGDPTAKLLGRISLNPLPHLDLIGTVALPILAILTGAPLIGWGKPVPVDPRNLSDPRRGELWISALGPLSNVFLAIVFAGIGWVEYLILTNSSAAPADGFMKTAAGVIYTICRMGVQLNLSLAIFNLIPVHPLDGGGVVQGLLPYRAAVAFENFSRYGQIILLVMFATGWLRVVFAPVGYLSAVLLPI